MNQTRLWLCSCVAMSAMALCWAQEPPPAPTEAAAPAAGLPATNAPGYVVAVTNANGAVKHPVVAPTNMPPAAGLHATNAPVREVVTNAPLVPVVEEKDPIPGEEALGETGSWMIGTRLTQFDLLDDKRGTPFNNSFMGSITELKAEQDDVPNKLFVQYRLVESPYWIGISYDHVRAATMDYGGSDGSVDLAGMLPYVQARWENTTRVVPYLEAGLAFYGVKFDEDPNWYAGGRRVVKLDGNVTGLEIAGGTAVRIYKGLSLDLYAQYMDVEDIKGAFYILGSKDGDAIFTMSHVTYGIGAQYQF